MKLQLKLSLRLTRDRDPEEIEIEPQKEGSFSQAEIAGGWDPTPRAPMGFIPDTDPYHPDPENKN